jgi:hypothetical protein
MAAIDWFSFVAKVPALIRGGVLIVDAIKKAGHDKKIDVINSVIEQVPAGVQLAESVSGKDLFNDPAIAQLLGAAVDAEAAAKRAHDALVTGLLTKHAA